MKKLEGVDLVRKVSGGVYFINPLAVWKGSTEAAIPEYLKINAILTDGISTTMKNTKWRGSHERRHYIPIMNNRAPMCGFEPLTPYSIGKTTLFSRTVWQSFQQKYN